MRDLVMKLHTWLTFTCLNRKYLKILVQYALIAIHIDYMLLRCRIQILRRPEKWI